MTNNDTTTTADLYCHDQPITIPDNGPSSPCPVCQSVFAWRDHGDLPRDETTTDDTTTENGDHA